MFSYSQGEVWVNGYTKSNGTYVEGHYRTAPNNKKNDNWTTVGNINPYTGKNGYLPREGNSSLLKNKSKQKASSYTNSQSSQNRVIHVGPRGGRYYINGNGNKTYIK